MESPETTPEAGGGDHNKQSANSPAEASVRNSDVFLRLAKESLDDDQAMININEAIRLDATNSEAFQLRGMLKASRRELAAAVADYLEAIRLTPKSAKARAMYATVLAERQEKGDLDKAISSLDEAIRLEPNYTFALAKRGYCRYLRGELDLAMKDLNQAVLLDPKEPFAYFYRAATLGEKRELHKALLDYNESIQLAPTWSLAFRDRGRCWYELGNLDRALEDLDRAITLKPLDAESYFHRAVVNEAKRNPAKALDDLKESLRLDPEDMYAYEQLAWIRACCLIDTVRDGKLAVQSATKACELSNWKNDRYIVTLAMSHAEAGQFADAKKRLKQAIDLAPATDVEFRAKLTELFEIGIPFHSEPRCVGNVQTQPDVTE